jgi:hypothetical protein
MNPRETEIRQQPSVLVFPQIAGGFQTPVDVLKPNRFVVRKVTAAGTIILPPGATEHVKVDYIPLPKGRSYNFSATHPTAANALVDASSPKLCLLTNPTLKSVKIHKHTRLGTIHECDAESTYFITDMKSAMKTFTFATALDQTYTPQDNARHDAIHLSTQVPLTPSSFEADSPAAAIDREFSPLHAPEVSHDRLDTGTSTKPTQEKPQPSSYFHLPYADQVNTVQGTKNDVIYQPFTTIFGIKPSEDAPPHMNSHTFAHNQKIAQALKKLCDSHDRVWKNERLIKVHGELKDHAFADISGNSIDCQCATDYFLFFFITWYRKSRSMDYFGKRRRTCRHHYQVPVANPILVRREGWVEPSVLPHR